MEINEILFLYSKIGSRKYPSDRRGKEHEEYPTVDCLKTRKDS